MTASTTKLKYFKPIFAVEKITPTKAKEYLTHNENNRRLRRSIVTRYAKDMTAGRWLLSGDPIVFSYDGILRQGQHRLTACVEANVAFETLVMRNADANAYKVMDTGEKRTLADILDHMGHVSSPHLAAAITLSWRWDTGQIRGTIQPTRQEALAWFDANPSVKDCLNLSSRVYDFIPRSQAAALAFRFRQVDEEASGLFFERLATGAGLADGDPLLTLRNWYLSRRKEGHNGGISRVPSLAVSVKAWNGFITSSPVRLLKWRGYAEPFPLIRDENGDPWPFPEVTSGTDPA